MSSISPVLRKKANKNGLFPIAIRITKDRKSTYLFTGQYIEEKHWDEKNKKVRKSHPNSVRINHLIMKKVSEYNDKLLEHEADSKTRSSHLAVKQEIRKEYSTKSFFSLANHYLNNLEKSGKHNRLSAEKPRVKHFREFLKGSDIDFRDITVLKLQGFQSYLKVNRNISERTIVNHLIVIRTIYNLAIKEKIVDAKFYPFGRGKITIKFPESIKLGLEVDELALLEKVEGLTAPEKHALNVWLFSFYFAGMRVSDVLRVKWSDFQNGRLFYSMGKNAKSLSLKIPEKASLIIEAYQKNDSLLVFPELEIVDFADSIRVQKTINNAVKKFNKHLKSVAIKANINKPLTMHIARHTFGNIAGDNIPIQMLQKLYRHSVVTTTINYQANFKVKDADDALESVINF